MIEDMKQALEALESYHGYMEPLTTGVWWPKSASRAKHNRQG
jgi:hypothetical protein